MHCNCCHLLCLTAILCPALLLWCHLKVYRLVLDAVCLQQSCGAAVSEEMLTALALAARCSTRAQVQQLLQQRGSELLQAMLKYVQQEPQQETAGAAADGESATSSSGAAATGGAQEAALRDLGLARRCVACATVFMEICSSGRRGVGELAVGLGLLVAALLFGTSLHAA